MASGNDTLSAKETQQTLKKLIQRAYPHCHDKGKLKEIKDQYWMRICSNHDSHRIKIINMVEWKAVTMELLNKAAKAKGTMMEYYANIKKIPIKQKILASCTTPTSKKKSSKRKLSGIK